jgi:predicted component of type VI protein secretion system
MAKDPVYDRPPLTAANGATSAAAATAGTVVADTGALVAGTYIVEVIASIFGVPTAGVGLEIQHRNAANSANVSVLGGTSPAGDLDTAIGEVTIAANERIRVVVGAVALPATTTATASVRAYRKP